MNKILLKFSKVFLILAVMILSGARNFCFAENLPETTQVSVKHNVLILHIIEENWDDLELALPKYDNEGTGPEQVTKKDTFKRFEDYDYKENYKVYKENRGNAFANQDPILKGKMEKVEKVREKLKDRIKDYVPDIYKSKGGVLKDVQSCVRHEIKYYGRAYLLKDEDNFMEDSFRLGGGGYSYYYLKIPEKISILVEPKIFYDNEKKYIPEDWNQFREIRLVEDVYILSCDKDGNLQIKFDNKNYKIDVGNILELPKKEADLTREQMMKFREKYYEYYKANYSWFGTAEGKFSSQLFQITSNKATFHFGTKITIINYGYVEIQ